MARLPAFVPAALRLALLVAGAVALAAWIRWLVPPLVNSDSAAVVLLAQELARSGGWVSPEWYYVSDSLMLDGSMHAARIGVLLFGAGIDAARFTVAAGIVLALLAGAWLGRVLDLRPSHSALGTLAFLLGPSLIYQDLILGLPVTFQVALVLAVLACAIRYGLQRGARWPLALAAGLILLMATSSPKKALVYLLLPVAAGVAAQWLPARDRDGSRRDPRRLAALLAGSALGWGIGGWLHALLKRGLVVNTSYARVSLVPEPAHVLDNLGTIGKLVWRFAGGGHGAITASAAMLAIACWGWLALGPVAVRRPWEALRGARGFAYAFAMAGTLAIGAYLLLSGQVRLYYGLYYAFVAASPLFVLAAGRPPGEGGATVRTVGSRVALALLLLSGIATTAIACRQFPADYFGIGKNQRSTSMERAQAIAWLEASGYRRGFADYWDANAMTLASGGSLQVASFHILARRSTTSRHAWLSTQARTNFVPGLGERWFIAINARRAALKPPPACLPAERMVAVSSYRLYLYSKPMPGCLPPPLKPRRGR